MGDDVINKLYRIAAERKQNPVENSYTCYLFKEGLDKILKKCGEECAETIIAAKNLNKDNLNKDNLNKDNLNKDNLKNEICDLIYHLVVLMAELNIPYSEIESVLEERSLKIGNLKQMKSVDKTS